MVNLKFVGKSYQFPFAVRPWKCEHLIHKTEGLPEGPDLLAPKEKAKIAEIFFFLEIRDYLKDGIYPAFSC